MPKFFMQSRLYCTKSLYYKFIVCRDIKELRASTPWAKLEAGAKGVCTSERKKVKGKLSPCLGQIAIIAKHCNMDVITHEIGHALLGWCMWTEVNPFDVKGATVNNCMPVDCGQEKFCHALGDMTQQAINALYKGGVWTLS